MDLMRETDRNIRNIAIRGSRDEFCRNAEFLDISYQVLGRFLVVYIEDYMQDIYYFRIFDCGKDAYYEMDLVLDPSYEDENYRCLYDHTDGEEEDLLYFADDEWYEDFKRAVEYYYHT